ncbi:NUDIX domain-containing protein [Streptomyces cellostaticus]|uniref:NUDIX domain-containing protein n=1 Tax=Streptomyces cellostaticus TaxID=67285 RepID=UPI0008344B6D|nr:NUDIX hydrolase [Streptomyces cellostaticus]
MADSQSNSSIARARVAAGVLFFDEQGRIMLVEPTNREDKFLGIPGGYVPPGESPYETAVRKVKEELGVDFPVGRPLVVDWAPSGDDEKMVFVFEGAVLGAEDQQKIRLNPDSASGFTFYEPERTSDPEMLMTRLIKRIEAAVPARAVQATVYLEHGEPLA